MRIILSSCASFCHPERSEGSLHSKHADSLLHCQCILNAEDAAAAALQAVQVGSAAESLSEVTGEGADICAFRASHTHHSTRQSKGRVVGHIDSAGSVGISVRSGFENNPSHDFVAGPSPCGQGGSTVLTTTTSEATVTTASSRINVTDNSALGLPRAEIRLACRTGPYVRAFARDLGESLGSGAHLDSLQRSRSGIFRVENALTVDQALRLL